MGERGSLGASTPNGAHASRGRGRTKVERRANAGAVAIRVKGREPTWTNGSLPGLHHATPWSGPPPQRRGLRLLLCPAGTHPALERTGAGSAAIGGADAHRGVAVKSTVTPGV